MWREPIDAKARRAFVRGRSAVPLELGLEAGETLEARGLAYVRELDRRQRRVHRQRTYADAEDHIDGSTRLAAGLCDSGVRRRPTEGGPADP